MKNLKFIKQDSQMGEVEGFLRVVDKICYFKYNDSQQAQNMMKMLQTKGAIITPGRSWIRVNIFGENKEVVLGKEQFNVDDKTAEEVEDIIIKFFALKYTEAGFICEITEQVEN